MATADRLWVVGFRAGQDFARYLGWQVLQVRSDVITLPRDGETLAESLAAIGPRDCVIVFALRRPPRMLGGLIDKMAQSGAATALIGAGGARAPAGALVVIEPIHDTLDEVRATGHAGAGITATVRIGSRQA